MGLEYRPVGSDHPGGIHGDPAHRAGIRSRDEGAREVPLAEIVLAARAARVTSWRRQVQCLTECQGAIRTAEQKLSATLREAGQAAIRADDLARRFGLTSAVPCAGTDLQGQCQLLGDAREASTLIPSAQAAIARLARETGRKCVVNAGGEKHSFPRDYPAKAGLHPSPLLNP